MSSYDTYSQHLKNATVPLLGMLCWYSVPESSEVLHKDFLVLVETSGAPIKLPELPRPADVFRRACNESKILKRPSGTTGRFYNYTMRDAGYDSNFVFRSVVEELVDSKNHSLGYEVLAQAIFNKENISSNFDIHVSPSHHSYSSVLEIQDSVNDFIRAKSETVTAIAVRESARRAVENRLFGTRVRPGGGVYFVNIDKAKELEAVDYVINNINGASFHILPLVDDNKQREMLKSSFEDESVEQTKELISDISELLKSNKDISAKKFTDIQTRYKQQKQKLDEYQSLLSDALDLSANQLKICNSQLIALLDKST
jgi:hypothetical protein